LREEEKRVEQEIENKGKAKESEKEEHSPISSPSTESDEIINQVLDEIGINLTSQLADTPLAATPATVTAAPAAPQKIAQPAEADLELQARLDKLKKS
jgi:division protein CdvB (Snf7/Vps24/ESCRT-III family)